MRLTFTKGRGKFDRLDIVTAGGPLAPIECPKQGIIPHDMVHFIVEAEVATRGFLGGIAAGGILPVVVHGGGPQIGAMLKRLGICASSASQCWRTSSSRAVLASSPRCRRLR
jgi:hypothetical protein